MSVALYDDDIVRYENTPFNIDIMKLSTFYKNKREIVVLSPSFVPEKYTKFIMRKDILDGIYPYKFNSYLNVSYGGLGFTNGAYFPMESRIEEQVADAGIYSKFAPYYDERMFKILTKAVHLRLSLDGKTLWDKVEKQINADKIEYIFLHDINPAQVSGAINFINELTENSVRKKVYVGSKNPLQFSSYKELSEWFPLYGIKNYFVLQHNGLMSDEEFYELIIKLTSTTKTREFKYNITGGSLSQDFVIKELPRIYRQALFSRSRKYIISLTYDSGFFDDPTWEEVIELINRFFKYVSRCEQDKCYSLFYYIRDFKTLQWNETQTPAEARKDFKQLLKFLYEKQYELFRLFYEVATVKLIGGKFVDG